MGYITFATPGEDSRQLPEAIKEHEERSRNYSAIEAISPDFFFVKKRFSDEKLLRLDSRLPDEASEKVLIDVGGRLGMSTGLLNCDVWLKTGDCALWRADIEPLGVLRFLVGNNPNCAVREDMDDPDRGVAMVGDMPEAPDTDEYAESFPVQGGLSSPLSCLPDMRRDVDHFSSAVFDTGARSRGSLDRVWLGSTCGDTCPRWPLLCQASW